MPNETPSPDAGRSSSRLLLAGLATALGLIAYQAWTVTSDIEHAKVVLGVKPLSAQEIEKRDAKERADEAAAVAALKEITDYQSAKTHPIHVKPAIDKATDAQCLACHQEVLTTKPRTTSPAGLAATASIAWYQTLDTYAGEQASFHARHLTTPFAREVMSLSCTFCHQGHDQREEAPRSSATGPNGGFTLRKVVDPSSTCLLCHGSFPAEPMGFEKGQRWHQLRDDLETADTPNGCLSCHAEQFRTVRHQVSYLKPEAIEAAAKAGSSDTCYGCHGGRSWYRNSYPYPRHPWPGMDAAVPDWAKSRPTASDSRYAIKK